MIKDILLSLRGLLGINMQLGIIADFLNVIMSVKK
jgi:hypothetical protein